MAQLKSDFPSGLIVPIATPITADERVAETELRRLVDFLIDGGVDALFALGTTGEVGALTDNERARILEIVIDAAANRVPVIAGVSAEGTIRVIRAIERLSVYGPDALAATPQYYAQAQSQSELVTFYRTIMAATDLPFILYNIPVITGITMAPETVAELAAIDNCVGLKAGASQLDYFQSLINQPGVKDNIRLLQGGEHLLLPSLLIGGDGGLNGIANLAPGLFASLLDAWRRGDLDEAQRCHRKVVALADIVYSSGENIFSVIKGGLSLLGLGDNRACSPSPPASDAVLQRLKPLLSHSCSGHEDADG